MKKGYQIMAITAAVTVLSASAALAEYAPDQEPIDRGDAGVMTTAASTAKDYVIVVNGVQLEKKGFLDGDKVMIPVRQLADALGFEVKWVEESETVQLIRGTNFVTFRNGVDGYTFAKTAPMPLGKAPVIVNDTTYVPVNFADEILHTTVTVDPSGSVVITDTNGDEEQKAYNATITKIENEKTLTVNDTQRGEVVLHIGEDTKLVGADGKEIKAADLKADMFVNVEYSEVMTASLPPQNTPVSITVVNVETPDIKTVTTSGKVLAVEGTQIVVGEDLTKPESQLVFNTDETTKFTKDGKEIKITDIKANDTIKATHSLAMTRSLPPQTFAYEIEVIDAKDAEKETVKIDGDITEIGENFIIIGDDDEQFRLNIDKDTKLTDENGKAVELKDLAKGMEVEAEHALATTFSIPPQSYAYTIKVDTESVKDADDDKTLPETMEIDGTIVAVEEGRVTIGDEDDINEQTILLVSDETEIVDEDGKALTMSDLKKGMEIKAVHKNIMTMSLPPQTPTLKIIVEK